MVDMKFSLFKNNNFQLELENLNTVDHTCQPLSKELLDKASNLAGHILIQLDIIHLYERIA